MAQLVCQLSSINFHLKIYGIVIKQNRNLGSRLERKVIKLTLYIYKYHICIS